MSLRRPIYNEGVGVFIEDDQATANALAAADDRVTEILAMPGTVAGPDGTTTNTKRVMPLADETASVNPRLLLIPSTTNGKVTVKPAWYGAANVYSGSSSAPLLKLAHTQYVSGDTDTASSNSSGSTKYQGVYATITRSVTETGARLQRNSSDVESTQTVNLATTTALTLGLTAQSASRAAALAAVPSDSSSAWAFFLGYVVVANGYAGTAIAQNSGAGSTYLEQGWDSGQIQVHRHGILRPATFYASGNGAVPPTILTPRHGQPQEIVVGWKYTSGPLSVTVDSSIDWRYRIVQTVLMRMGANAPESTTGQMGVQVDSNAAIVYAFTSGNASGPIEVGWGFSGDGSVTPGGEVFFYRSFATIGSGAGSIDVSLNANSTTGALELVVSGAASANGGGDHWIAVLRAYPQHVLSG